jgi:ATP-dependent DNA helicase RecQ
MHPKYEALLTTLLRTYEGIFDFPAAISEPVLARLLRTTEEAVHEDLKKLAAYSIIDYAPHTDAPQIYFRRHRVAADDLTFNQPQYHKRKEAYAVRVQQMISYIKATTCRSTTISRYFGEKNSVPCGRCDNCLYAKKTALSEAEFQQIYTAIKKRTAFRTFKCRGAAATAQRRAKRKSLEGDIFPPGRKKALHRQAWAFENVY